MEFDYAIKGNFYQQCDYLLKHLKNWKNCELRTLNSRILFIHVEFITYPRLEPYQKRISDLKLNVYNQNPENFHTRAAYYESIGNKITYHKIISDIKGPNQKERQNNYFTHCFYLYYGKSEPQLVRALMNVVKVPQGGFIFDPFCGSGSMLLEANLIGINAIGNDVSPLACLLSSVKTKIFYFDVDQIRRKFVPLENLKKWNNYPNKFQDLDNIDQFYLMSYLAALSDQRYLKITIDKAYNILIDRYLQILDEYQKKKDMFQHFTFGSSEIWNEDASTLGNKIQLESIDLVITFLLIYSYWIM